MTVSPHPRAPSLWRDLAGRWERFRLRGALTARRRIELYEQLASMLGHGIQEEAALTVLARIGSRMGRHPNRPLARLTRLWRDRLRAGASLQKTLAPWLPERDRLMLRDAPSDRLPAILRDLAQTSAALERIRGIAAVRLRTALGGVALALGILVWISLTVVPAFTTVIEVKRTGATGLLVDISGAIQDWGLVIGLGSAAAIVATVLSLTRWTGRGRVLADRLFPWSVYRVVTGTGWLFALSGMLGAGMQQPQALDLLRRTGSPYVAARTGAILRQAERKNLAQAMWATGTGFPDEETVLALMAYIETTDLPEAMARLARVSLADAERRIAAQTAVIEIIGKGLTAAVLGISGIGLIGLIGQIQSVAQTVH